MKHFLLTAIAAVLSMGCIQLEQTLVNKATVLRETRGVSGDEMEFRKGLRYVKGESKPFTGTVTEYSSGLKPTFDRLKRVTPYVDGKVNGSAITYGVQN